jgi:hypothetical protein
MIIQRISRFRKSTWIAIVLEELALRLHHVGGALQQPRIPGHETPTAPR